MFLLEMFRIASLIASQGFFSGSALMWAGEIFGETLNAHLSFKAGFLKSAVSLALESKL